MMKTLPAKTLATVIAVGFSGLLSGCGSMETSRPVPPPPGSDKISNQAWSGAGRDAAWEGGTPFGMPGSR